jgi:hypothetical protein
MKNSAWTFLTLIAVLTFADFASKAEAVDNVIRDTADYRLWSALSGERIMQDSRPEQTTSNEIQISLAKNEVESFQLIITPKTDVTVNLTSLPVSKDLEVLCNTVGFVKEGGTSIPDVLFDCGPQVLEKDKNGIFWITVKTFRETKAGDYVLYAMLNDKKIKLNVHVFGFALPSKSSIKTVGRIWWKKEMSQKVELRNIYDNLKDHRIFNGGYVMPVPQVTIDSITNHVAIDFTKFDETAKYLVRELGYDGYFVPFAFGGWEGLANDKWLNKIPVRSKEFEKYYGEYLVKLARHLKENGLLDKAYIQPWDEPQKKDLDSVARIAKIVRLYAPHLKIYLTALPQKELYGLVDVWTVPLMKGKFDLDKIRERQAKGEEVWGYQNNYFNYSSHPLQMRLLPWRIYKYGLQGLEWWAVNRWDEFFGISPQLMPGNGVFIYYPRDDHHRRPLNSIRWELYRDGLEDAEYFVLLEKKVGKEAVNRYVSELIKGVDPDEGVVDPALLERLRITIGGEIEKHYNGK